MLLFFLVFSGDGGLSAPFKWTIFVASTVATCLLPELFGNVVACQRFADRVLCKANKPRGSRRQIQICMKISLRAEVSLFFFPLCCIFLNTHLFLPRVTFLSLFTLCRYYRKSEAASTLFVTT